MIYIFTAIYILDPSRTKSNFETEQEAYEYVYSQICERCKRNIKNLKDIFDTPCCFGFWWLEDDDEL